MDCGWGSVFLGFTPPSVIQPAAAGGRWSVSQLLLRTLPSTGASQFSTEIFSIPTAVCGLSRHPMKNSYLAGLEIGPILMASSGCCSDWGRGDWRWDSCIKDQPPNQQGYIRKVGVVFCIVRQRDAPYVPIVMLGSQQSGLVGRWLSLL